MTINDDKWWDIIESINWKERHDYTNIGKELEKRYTEQELETLAVFIKYQRSLLTEVLMRHAHNETGDLYDYYGVSDDGFWDLTAHIVGLGKETFNDIMYNNPERAKEIADESSYVENFEYIFHYAYEAKNKGSEQQNIV